MRATVRRVAGASGEAGQALVLVALCTGALVLLLGLGVDVGGAFAARHALQAAVDAAALAGAAQAVETDEVDARGIVYTRSLAVDPVEGPRVAERFLTAFGPSLTGVSAAAAGDQLSVTAAAAVPSYFLRAIGIEATTVHAAATARVVFPDAG